MLVLSLKIKYLKYYCSFFDYENSYVNILKIK